jgi:hypothetical protein
LAVARVGKFERAIAIGLVVWHAGPGATAY